MVPPDAIKKSSTARTPAPPSSTGVVASPMMMACVRVMRGKRARRYFIRYMASRGYITGRMFSASRMALMATTMTVVMPIAITV